MKIQVGKGYLGVEEMQRMLDEGRIREDNANRSGYVLKGCYICGEKITGDMHVLRLGEGNGSSKFYLDGKCFSAIKNQERVFSE